MSCSKILTVDLCRNFNGQRRDLEPLDVVVLLQLQRRRRRRRKPNELDVVDGLRCLGVGFVVVVVVEAVAGKARVGFGSVLVPELFRVHGLFGLVAVLATGAAGLATGSRVAVAADVPLRVGRQQRLEELAKKFKSNNFGGRSSRVV